MNSLAFIARLRDESALTPLNRLGARVTGLCAARGQPSPVGFQQK